MKDEVERGRLTGLCHRILPAHDYRRRTLGKVFVGQECDATMDISGRLYEMKRIVLRIIAMA